MDTMDIPSAECVEEAEQEVSASIDDWCGDDIFMWYVHPASWSF